MTQEVPVTVETVRTITATREVPVTQQVPVTVVVPQTVEVTREVLVPQTVEVTRQVPVTRASTATPAPTSQATPTDVTDKPTPAPTATIPPSPTATPVPEPSSPFDGWTMETEDYAYRKLMMFHTTAVSYGTLPEAPVLTYQCDNQGYRSLYIDWRYPIVTYGAERRYDEDPFADYRNDHLEALLNYADDLIAFTGDLRLDSRQQQDLDDLWDEVQDKWLYRHAEPPTPDDLVEHARKLTYGQSSISPAFYQERTDPEQRSRYGPPELASIEGHWFVSHHHARLNAGSMGELRPGYREAFPSSYPVANTVPVMTATVIRPAQPMDVMAKWVVKDLLKVMAHCEIAAR